MSGRFFVHFTPFDETFDPHKLAAAYGTGLLSSAGEQQTMQAAELLPFDPGKMSLQEYDPTKYQPILFCGDSFEAMHQTLREFVISYT